MNKRIAVAFTGPSNNGKTTLVTKIATILTRNYKVAIVKNDPKDKAQFDIKGKDSYKFTQTGAEVVVTSPNRTTYFSNRHKSLNEIIDMLGVFEILIFEGLRTLPLPRIGVFRNKIDSSYFDYIDAIAIDDSIDLNQIYVDEDIDILDLNNPQGIVEWILSHAKEV